MLDHTKGTAYTLTVSRRFSLVATEYEQRDVIVDFKTGEKVRCRVPKAWSDNAAATLMSKYAVRAGVPASMGGVNGREVDAEMIFRRLVAGWRAAAIEHGYWDADDDNLAAFCDEIKAMLEQQRAAPNSPQWFNTGVRVQYGIEAGSDGHYYATTNPDGTATAHACTDSLAHPQISACFIQSVGDQLVGDGGIMDLWTREARLFKYGSGSGANYSALRGKGEPLSRGGASSGLLSFLRVGDRSAGAIKSGGTCLAPWQRVYTARGPVAVKELADAGDDFIVVSYDPPAGRYMAKTARAWLAGHKHVVKVVTDKGEFYLTDDHPVRLSCGQVRRAGELVTGNSLFRCSIDNRFGYTRVHLRNGMKGKESLHRLVAVDVMGCDLTGLIVHHVDGNKQNNAPSNLQIMTQAEHASEHSRELVEQGEHVFQSRSFAHVGESNGMHADSAFWQDPIKVAAFRQAQSDALTRSGRASDMARAASDQRMLNTAFKVLNAGLPIDTFENYIAGRKQVIGRIPSIKQTRALINKKFGSYDNFVQAVADNNHRVVSVEPVGMLDVYDVEVDCPTPDDKSPESGHNFVIWSDDSHFGSGIVVFNTRRSARMVIVDCDHPDIEEFVTWKAHEDDKIRALHAAGYGDPASFEDEATETVSGQNANNSVAVTDAFMQAAINCEPWDLHARVDGHVTSTINAADLWHSIADAAWKCADPGLQFADTINRWHTCKADGPIRASNPCCLVQNTLVHTERGYVRIGELAALCERDEQLPKVWAYADGTYQLRACLRAWKAGDSQTLRSVETTNGLRIECTPEHPFMLKSGAYVEAQHLSDGDELAGPEDDRVDGVHVLVAREPVFDIEVEGVHNFLVTSDADIAPVVVHNSEYVFLDDTACNLASINLAKFYVPGTITGFDWDGYAHAARLWTIVLDISVSMAGYPTAEIARRSMLYRTLGLGYAALGELLVMLGLGYGTAAGRAFAADVTSTLTRIAYLTSSELARRLGAFPRYEANKEHVLEVLNMHGRYAPECEREGWQQVYVNALTHGVRNAQVSLLAPCGTIGIVMDCETTGVEPFYSDTTYKTLAGGGVMRLASKRFAEVLRDREYNPTEYMRRVYTVERGRVLEYVWIEPPADLADVLVCASDLTPEQHVDMMAALQPFLSGAQSKTVNMPSTATVDDVARMYEYAWRKGLKSIAIYRDGCKPSQPLQGRKPAPGVKTYATREEAERWRDALVPESVPVTVRTVEVKPTARGERVEPPTTARAVKHRVELSGHTFYLILGEHDDGSLAEVFVTCSRTGSAIAGWVNAWAKLFSLALQHGTPLDVLVSAMRGESFEPVGYHEGRPTLSPVDCFARIIEARYLADSDAPTHEPAEQNTAPLFSGSVEQFAKATPFTATAVRDAMNKPTGQTCITCGSTDLARSGACFVCRKCGSTTGCS